MMSAMTIRISFVGAVMLVLIALPASAQGRPPQQVVLSEAVVKSMAPGKVKSKTPLTARVGMVRRAKVVATTPATPTSVREIAPAAKKN